MEIQTLSGFFERDLQKLITEVNLYKDEDKLWLVAEGISNSAGNLCLHLIGNLNHFIGATLGHTGYVRHRDDEFTLNHIPRQDLLLNLNNCIIIVKDSLQKITDKDLNKDFPLEKNGETVSTRHMLLHLLAHLSYHLGQVNYHRRILDHDQPVQH